MAKFLTNLRVRNYRSLADVAVELDALNVIFGPNGAGKSSLLDTVWFVRDCANHGVEQASSSRSHGIGMLWDGAEPGDHLSIELGTGEVRYELRFGLSSGRIEPFPGERLTRSSDELVLIDRKVGSDRASFFNLGLKQMVPVELREPDKLSLGRFLDFDGHAAEAAALDHLLRHVKLHHCRFFDLLGLKQRGSEAGYETRVDRHGKNLWSVLRNLKERRRRDDRYDTIIGLMREAFPGSFDDLEIAQTGPSSVYASVIEIGRREPIHASGISDGHLQMLVLLTVLFAEGAERDSLIVLDEPEISLHPWPLVVLGKALRLATERWSKQVLVATHSPVLLSQFEAEQVLAAEVVEGQTKLHRASEIEEIQDLLEDYALGSLYMAGQVARQGPPDTALEDEEPNAIGEQG